MLRLGLRLTAALGAMLAFLVLAPGQGGKRNARPYRFLGRGLLADT